MLPFMTNSKRIDASQTDEEILHELGRRLRRERLDRDLTVQTVADRAGLAERTVRNVEEGHPSSISTILAVLRVYGMIERLEALIPDRGPSPIHLADSDGKVRKRASKRSHTAWEW